MWLYLDAEIKCPTGKDIELFNISRVQLKLLNIAAHARFTYK